MYIKKYFILILFLFIFLQAKATGQDGDVIIIDGKEWALMTRVVWSAPDEMEYRLKRFIPANHSISTANWDGYTAFWEVKNNYLYFKRLEIRVIVKETKRSCILTYDAYDMRKVFAPYYKNGKICASWMSGQFRASQGELLLGGMSGYQQNNKTEMVFTMKAGKIVKSTIYHNFKRQGINLQEASKRISKRFPWSQFPEYKGLKILFAISNPKVTEHRNVTDLDVTDIRINNDQTRVKEIKDKNDPLAIAIKKTILSINPWETYRINGKDCFIYPKISLFIQEHNNLQW